MANMICECGNRISTTLFPNCIEGEIKGIFEFIKRYVWECPYCGRLWIDIKDPENENLTIPKCYVPENGKKGDLFDIGNEKQFKEYIEFLWIYYKENFRLFGFIE